MSCHHAHAKSESGHDLAARLEEARARVERVGERFTASRRRVLELLLETGGPVKAYDLMARFTDAGAPAKPPTVYRALDFLESQGLVHRLESLGAFVACHHGEGGHAAGFLICDCCGAASEVELPAAALSAGQGFTVRSLTFEARGLCADCRA